MIYLVTVLVGLSFGVLIGTAASRYAIGKRQATRRDLSAELSGAGDLEPTEFSHGWERR